MLLNTYIIFKLYSYPLSNGFVPLLLFWKPKISFAISEICGVSLHVLLLNDFFKNVHILKKKMMSMAWQKEIYCAASHLTFFVHSEQGTMPIWCFQEITRFFQLLGDLFLPVLHILALISVRKLCFLLLLQIHWIIILIFL